MNQNSTVHGRAVYSFAQGRAKLKTGDHPKRPSPHFGRTAHWCALFLAGFCFLQEVFAQPSTWPRFRFNAGLTGRAGVEGPQLPEIFWIKEIGAEKIESPVIAPDRSIIFTSRGDEFVYALNPDGSEKWRYAQPRPGGGNEKFSAPPVIGQDGNIYVGTQHKSFLSLDSNGNLRWRVAVGGWVSSSANVAANGNLYLAVDDGQLYVFAPGGNLLCKGSFDGEKPNQAPALGANGRVYAPAGNSVYVFDANCQRLAKWSPAALGEVAWVVLSDDGATLYAGALNKPAVVALNAATGSQIWVHTYDQLYGPPSMAALGPDGSIYFATFERGLLIALTSGGQTKNGWPRDLGSAQFKTMPSVDASGDVYIVSEHRDFGLFKLSPNNVVQWQLPQVQCKYSIAIGPDSTLYVPSLKKIYAVRQKPPRIVAQPNALEFGKVCLNDSLALQTTLTNTGFADLIISRYELVSPVFKVAGTPVRLKPGESHIITVTFTPTAAGVYEGTLLVFSNDPDQNPYRISLRGEGTAPQIAGPASADFPDTEVGDTTRQTIFIRAEGLCDLRLDRIFVSTAEFRVVPVTLPVTIAPADSFGLVVEFIPQTRGGKQDTLRIFSNDPGSNPFAITLQGNGKTTPKWRVDPDSLTFASCVGDSSALQEVIVRNTGIAEVVITKAEITNSVFELATNLTLPFSLSANATLTLKVRFRASDTNLQTGKLRLESNAGIDSVAFTGRGDLPQIRLSARPPQIEVCRGQSGQTQIVVFNPSATCTLIVDSFKVAIVFSGQALAQTSSIVTHPASALITILPGDSAVIPFEVTQPPRDFVLRVTFWSNAGGSPHLITVPGKVLPPAIAADNSVDFGGVFLQESRTLPAKVWNAAKCDLRLLSARISGGDTSAFTVEVSALPKTLSAGDTLRLPVTFTPRRLGAHVDTLLVENDDPDSNPVRIILRGEGTQNIISARPRELSFEICLGKDGTQIITIFNDGDTEVVSNSLGFILRRPEFSVEPTGDFRVPAKGSNTVVVGFKPVTIETVKDTLIIVWQNSNIPATKVPVSGKAVSGQIAGPEGHVFPPTLVKTTEIDTVFVRNTGRCDLLVDSTRVVNNFSGPDAPPFKVEGNYRGRLILPGDSLGIAVSFRPPDTIEFDGTLLVYNSDTGVNKNPFGIVLRGRGRSQEPDIAVMPDTLQFGAPCNPAQRELKIWNEGDTTLTITALTFPDPAYSTARVVPFSLAPDETTTVVVAFNPALVQSSTATLSLLSNDPDENPYEIVLVGSKGQPDIAGADLVNFPETQAGRTSRMPYVIRNEGVCVLRVDSLWIAGQHPFGFKIVQAPNTPFEIAPGESDTVRIEFASKDIGEYFATLNISNNDPDANEKIKVVQLRGNGVAVPPETPDIEVSPQTLTFGAPCDTSQRSLVIANIGNDTLKVDSLKFSHPAYSTTTTVPFNVAPGATKIIVIVFNAAAAQSSAATLTIFSNDPDEKTVQVALSGSKGQPDIAGANEVLFPETEKEQTSKKFYAIHNNGPCTLRVNGLEVSGDHATDFLVPSAPATPFEISNGDSVKIEIAFTPSALGERRAVLNITSNGDESPKPVQLRGAGKVADISVSPDPLDFGKVLVGKDSCAFVFVENNFSHDSLTVTSAELSQPGTIFTVEIQGGGNDLLLKPGEVGTIEVCFKPPALGKFENELRVKIVQIANGKSGPDSLFIVKLLGEGVAGRLLVQPLAIPFGQVNLFDSKSLISHEGIKNSGTAPLIVKRIEEPGPYYKIKLARDLPATLQPGEAITFTATFSPTIYGDWPDRFIVHSDAYYDSVQVVKLLGKGHLDVALKVSPVELKVDEYVGREDTVDFTITNLGPIDVTNVTTGFGELIDQEELQIISPAFPYPILRPNKSIEVQVKFGPKAARTQKTYVFAQSEQTSMQKVDLTAVGKGRPGRRIRPVPEVFTPNDDGYNEEVVFSFKDEEDVFEPELKIFNMRGQFIFSRKSTGIERTARQMTWNGRDRENRVVPPHTYLWIMQDGDRLVGSGHVGVLR